MVKAAVPSLIPPTYNRQSLQTTLESLGMPCPYSGEPFQLAPKRYKHHPNQTQFDARVVRQHSQSNSTREHLLPETDGGGYAQHNIMFVRQVANGQRNKTPLDQWYLDSLCRFNWTLEHLQRCQEVALVLLSYVGNTSVGLTNEMNRLMTEAAKPGPKAIQGFIQQLEPYTQWQTRPVAFIGPNGQPLPIKIPRCSLMKLPPKPSMQTNA